MRSGIGTPAIHVQDDDLERTRKRLVATVAVMTRKAGQYALHWALHDGRKEVSASDINAALKHQARHFLQTVDRPSVIEEIQDMECMIYDATTSEEDSEDYSDTDDTASSLPKPSDQPYYERVERDGRCVCRLCTEIREAVDTWDSWHPEDEAEIYLKKSVNLAIAAAQKKIPLE
jgi:hypothetical protein